VLYTQWFCCRDFNEILVSVEKQGATLHPHSQMDAF
jgi:hypothetical protein